MGREPTLEQRKLSERRGEKQGAKLSTNGAQAFPGEFVPKFALMFPKVDIQFEGRGGSQ